MWKAAGILVSIIVLLHFYLLARTGYISPCKAAFAKIEYENIGTFKNQRRELAPDPEQEELFAAIDRGEILKCYRIALFYPWSPG